MMNTGTVNTNNVLGAIRSSFDDSRLTYTLGFYPAALRNDGSFHRLKLKLPGRNHLALHYRPGYFEPEPLARDPRRHEAELRRAVWGNLKQDTYDSALRSGLVYSLSYRPNPKASSLRVIVRDLTTGNIGTLTIPAPA